MAINIATKMNDFNVYRDGTKQIGTNGEISLPDFDAITDTISGAGILGEIDEPTIGHFGNMEVEITYRMLDEEPGAMMDQRVSQNITLRGAQQTTSTEGNIEFQSIKIVLRGRTAKFSPGTIKAGSQMETKVTLNLLYILITVNGKDLIELDKLNSVYKVAGDDVLAEVKEMC